MKKQINEAGFQPHTQQKNHIKHAVILAAGKSSRFREKGIQKPKVLLPIGGLRLMERSILTLRAAGVESDCKTLMLRLWNALILKKEMACRLVQVRKESKNPSS